jgi:hypothetical protein
MDDEVHVCLRRARVSWRVDVPRVLAENTRVVAGDVQHAFYTTGSPRHTPAYLSDQHLVDTPIGRATQRAVDPGFADGTYDPVRHNCTTYSFCLLSALFGEAHLARVFPPECNNLTRLLFGHDYVAVNRRAGCVEALALAADPDLAAREVAGAAGADQLGAVLARCGDRARRDPRVRAAPARDPLVGFLWASLAWATARHERLLALVAARVPPE